MKQFFLQRTDLEIIIDMFIKLENDTRDTAIKKLNNLLKEVEPTASVIVLDKFSAKKQ